MIQDDILLSHLLTLIPHRSRVLDLGCGDGHLLAQLKRLRQVEGYGIDKSFDNVLSCIRQGISVYQGNLNEGLSGIPDQSYDVVLLSQTLQEIRKPVFLLNEMLRVSKKVIVTFPNFGHWRLRSQIFFKGQTPTSETLPFDWYDTPNIRIITIKDFKKFCRHHGIQILEEHPLYPNPFGHLFPKSWSNLLCEKGLFVLMSDRTEGEF